MVHLPTPIEDEICHLANLHRAAVCVKRSACGQQRDDTNRCGVETTVVIIVIQETTVVIIVIQETTVVIIVKQALIPLDYLTDHLTI